MKDLDNGNKQQHHRTMSIILMFFKRLKNLSPIKPWICTWFQFQQLFKLQQFPTNKFTGRKTHTRPLRIVGSQITGGLDIPEPCVIQSQTPSFLQGPMILRERDINNILSSSSRPRSNSNKPTNLQLFVRVSVDLEFKATHQTNANKRNPQTHGCFQKLGVPQNGWFIMENPDLNGWFGGTHIFWKPPHQTPGKHQENNHWKTAVVCLIAGL